MNIQLNRLSVYNFKGIRHFEAEFGQTTNIYGDNATGKTSVFDSFLWLLFGKNSQGESQFDIKPIDAATGTFVKNVEVSVEATLTIGGITSVLRKVLKQKWVTRRGQQQEEYQGDESAYWWNDVPMAQTKIAEFIDEAQLRLITDPFFFANMKWQERRNILMGIAGKISPDMIIASITEPGNYEPILEAFAQNKSLAEFKTQISAQKKKLKDEKEMIPSRIDEVRRSIPEIKNFADFRNELEALEGRLSDINASINQSQSALSSVRAANAKAANDYQQALTAHGKKVAEVNAAVATKEQQLRNTASSHATELISKKESLLNDQKEIESRIALLSGTKERLAKRKADLELQLQAERNEYDKTHAHVFEFNEADCKCPTCLRQFDAENIEKQRSEAEANFNNRKARLLSEISERGKSVKADLEQVERDMINITEQHAAALVDQSNIAGQLAEISAEIDTMPATDQQYEFLKSQSEEYQKILAQQKELAGIVIEEPAMQSLNDSADTTERDRIHNRITEVRLILADEQRISEMTKRLEELEAQEAVLGEQIANHEGIEYAILQYAKAEMSFVDAKINGMFKFVKFRMFKTQVNGGETETCDIMVNTNGSWVPFQSGNRAGQINAGVDIINTLAAHYGTTAPIFIDNRESVTQLCPSDAQVINLFVSMSDKTLRVGNGKMAEAI
jgi:DNA repair exonuclease SbcCD ATPase subunit